MRGWDIGLRRLSFTWSSPVAGLAMGAFNGIGNARQPFLAALGALANGEPDVEFILHAGGKILHVVKAVNTFCELFYGGCE